MLKRIKETGDIFFAMSDREWILDGANVHVSMIGFDDGSEKPRTLDGKVVDEIHSNLTAAADMTQAQLLKRKSGIQGNMQSRTFRHCEEDRNRMAEYSESSRQTKFGCSQAMG